MLRTARDRGNHRLRRDLLQRIGEDLERRNAARYPLRVPVLFSWSNAGVEQKGGGFTRDVSPEGAYILCDIEEYPRAGANVKIELMLPPIDPEAHAARLRSKGLAVRTGRLEEERGFAVAAVFTMHETAADFK